MKPISFYCLLLALTPSLGWADAVTTDDLFRADIDVQAARAEGLSCGDGTVAVITTDENDVYVFCADEDGDIAVLEAKSSAGDRSLLDEIIDPVRLLKTLVPAGVSVPTDVIASIRSGKIGKGFKPFTIGRPDFGAAANAAGGATEAGCSAPSLGFSPSVFFNDTTYCGWVSGSSVSNNDPDWHAHGASYMNIPGEGSANHAGPHVPPFQFYFANEDEEGDARFGRIRARSCGGTTRLRAWKKASPTTGSWSLKGTWHVPDGWLYTIQYYGNPQHSMWMGYDADDIYFKAEALGSATFGSRIYFLKYAYGENCAMKF